MISFGLHRSLIKIAKANRSTIIELQPTTTAERRALAMVVVSQVAENETRETEETVASFFHEFQIAKLLRRYLAEKQKGASAISIFLYLFCWMFSDRSMYMQMKLNRWAEDFRKDTVYRFLIMDRRTARGFQ